MMFQELYGPKYVWFFIGWYEDNWFKNNVTLKEENINCTVEQMKEAAEGHFTTEALQWNQDKSPTISGKVNKLLTNPYTFPRNSFCVSNLQFLQVFIDELFNDSI